MPFTIVNGMAVSQYTLYHITDRLLANLLYYLANDDFGAELRLMQMLRERNSEYYPVL